VGELQQSPDSQTSLLTKLQRIVIHIEVYVLADDGIVHLLGVHLDIGPYLFRIFSGVKKTAANTALYSLCNIGPKVSSNKNCSQWHG
jgi:hypothetical protein